MDRIIKELDTGQNEYLRKTIYQLAHRQKGAGPLNFDELVNIGVVQALEAWKEDTYDPARGMFAPFVYERIRRVMFQAQVEDEGVKPELSDHYNRATKAISKWQGNFYQEYKREPILSDAINDLCPKGFSMAQIKTAWDWLNSDIQSLDDDKSETVEDDEIDYIEKIEPAKDEQDDFFDENVGLATPWEFQDKQQWLRQMVKEKNPPEIWDIYHRRACMGLKPREVRVALDITTNQYQYRRRKLLKYLKELLEEYPNEVEIYAAIDAI